MNIPGLQQLNELEQQHGLPTGLLAAVMNAESGGNPNAVSPAGAQGLFQFMPATAKELGIDPLNPQEAAEGAAKYYGQLSKKYGGDVPQMLAAYNWGMGNVDRQGLEAAPKETKDYIAKVSSNLNPQAEPSDASSEDFTDAERQELIKLLDADAASDAPELTPEEVTAVREMLGIPMPEQVEQPAGRQKLQAPGALVSGIEAAGSKLGGAIKPLTAAAEQFGAGIFSNYADEITDPIMAAIGSASTGIPYDQFLQATREQTQQRLQEQQAKYPKTSALAQLAGGVSQLVGAGGALKAAAPAVAARGAQLAQTSPYLSAMGVGAAQGALAGSGAATEGKRGEGAVLGGVIGGALAPAAAYVGRNVAEPIKQYGLKWVADKFGAKTVTPSASTALKTVEDEFIPAVSTKPGEIFPKTAGQRSQVADIQRLETAAEAGHLSPKASEAFAQAKTLQNQEFKRFMSTLAGGDEKTINESIDRVGGVIKNKAGAAWENVNNAYDLAKKGGGAKIDINDINQGLALGFKQVRDKYRPNLKAQPNTAGVIKDFAKLTTNKMNKITSVKLQALEQWRAAATTARNNSNSPSEKAVIGEMIGKYDDFMERTAAAAADSSDASAISAFRDAVKKRAEYGRLFEKNKVVDKLIEGNLSVDDARRLLIGAGTIKSKSNMLDNYKAIKAAAGDEGEAVAGDLRNAFIHDIVKKSFTSYAPGNVDEMVLSPAKLATGLKALFQEQSDFSKELFGEKLYKQALQGIKELDQISRKQPKVESSSGSGEYLARVIMQKMDKIPGLSRAIDIIERDVRGNKAIKNLEEFMDVQTFRPISSKWSTVPAQVTGQQVGEVMGRPSITITEGIRE